MDSNVDNTWREAFDHDSSKHDPLRRVFVRHCLQDLRGGRHAWPPGSSVWTIDTVQSLGTTTDVQTASAVLGIGRTKAYELAKEGQFPVPLFKIGRRYVVPVPSLLAALGAVNH